MNPPPHIPDWVTDTALATSAERTGMGASRMTAATASRTARSLMADLLWLCEPPIMPGEGT